MNSTRLCRRAQILPSPDANPASGELRDGTVSVTAANVRTLPVPEGKGEETYWHTALPAFGLRVRIGGARGYIVQYEFGRIKHKMTLGPIHVLTLSQAMGKARDALALVRIGRDPAGEKLENRQKASITFGSLLPGYLKFKQAETKSRSFLEIDRHLSVHAKPLHPVAIERPDPLEPRIDAIDRANARGIRPPSPEETAPETAHRSRRRYSQTL